MSQSGLPLQPVHLPQELVVAQPYEQVLEVTSQSGLVLQAVHLPQLLVLAQPYEQDIEVASQSGFPVAVWHLLGQSDHHFEQPYGCETSVRLWQLSL